MGGYIMLGCLVAVAKCMREGEQVRKRGCGCRDGSVIPTGNARDAPKSKLTTAAANSRKMRTRSEQHE